MSRIGMFTYSTQPRGSVVHAASLSEALVKRGHDVALFALSKDGGRFFRDVACPLQLIPAAPAPEEMDALIAQRIAELAAGLEALAPELDVLHAQDCLVASGLLEARRRQPSLAACPLVRTVHHVEQFESPYLTECQRHSVLAADLLLSVSQATADDVVRAFGRKSELVPNGVDLERFGGPPTRLRAEALLALGQPSHARLVLSVGGVEPRKNSRRCLEAMARVFREVPDAVWIIAGGASVLDHRAYRDAFDADLAALPASIQRRVVRTGTLHDRELTELYQIAQVLLGASKHEGFGLSVLEGMAAALPVVVPRQPPFTEYVPPHAASFVDPTSPSDIAAAVLELLESPALRTRLGRLGPDIARDFSWERSADRHAQLYARALAAQAPHALDP
jgi:glycosyltransferase-like protein